MMEFLAGSEKRFFDFISNITDKDKIAVISHGDMDGMVPVLIIERVLGKIDFLEFPDPKKDIILSLISQLKKSKINKIIITDLNLNNESSDTQKELEKFAEILIIDHHQAVKDFNTEKTVFILTEKKFNVGLSTYYLFRKFQNLDSIDFMAAISVITDYSWEENAEFLKEIEKKYKLKPEKDIHESDLGKFTRIIEYCNAFFRKSPLKFYKLLKQVKNLCDVCKLVKYSNKVEKDIENTSKDFLKNKETYNWGYLYNDKSKYSIAIKAISSLKDLEQNKLFVTYRKEDDGLVHISARRQDSKLNCADVLKQAVKGLREASAGGHVPAAGGRVMTKDFKKFKENLINLLGN
jgi:oligoribonuclease NrnB/cAMP/cGMP phosphodiesterase (DHH superfamily)